jgi:DNA-binding CsgD family transcriptional regulator
MHRFDARFAPSGRAYQKHALRARDHEIIRLHLLGAKNVDIAARLGVTPVTVSNTLNSAAARAYVQMLSATRDSEAVDLSRSLSDCAPRAFEFLRDDVLENENAPIYLRARVADTLLGLAGFVRPQRIQVSGQISHITPADLEEIKHRAALAAAECGLLAPSSSEAALDAEFHELKSSVDGQHSTQQDQGNSGLDASPQLTESHSVAIDSDDESEVSQG